MNGTDKIISKIKKLLALAKSPNPNEAANALKMAQELMSEHKIGISDVNTLDVGVENAPATCRESVPRYEILIVTGISKAFGCKSIRSEICGKKIWRFIGLRHRAQIASYICQVLLRKLKSARADYIKSLYRVRSKYRKTQRADDFCLSWVSAVTDKLAPFAGISEEEEKAVELYVQKNYPMLLDINIKKRSFGNAEDYRKGFQAGNGVELQHGVGVHIKSPLQLGA